MANLDINDLVGDTLEEEYGGLNPQDLHINYFYLILGMDSKHRKSDILALLNAMKTGQWINLETEWPGFLIGEFPKISEDETERHREERLGTEIAAFTQDPNSKITIIISRACKYRKAVSSDICKTKLSTCDIERVLMNSYDIHPQNIHVDYFYLALTFWHRDPEIEANVPSMLSRLPGDWKPLTPAETWPHVYVGYFPKQGMFETERAREWRLNKQVRDRLKDEIKQLILRKTPAAGMSGSQKVVSILFTRACKYTHM